MWHELTCCGLFHSSHFLQEALRWWPTQIWDTFCHNMCVLATALYCFWWSWMLTVRNHNQDITFHESAHFCSWIINARTDLHLFICDSISWERHITHTKSQIKAALLDKIKLYLGHPTVPVLSGVWASPLKCWTRGHQSELDPSSITSGEVWSSCRSQVSC